MSDRIYYRVEPDSPVMDVIKKAYETHREFSRAMVGLRKEIGAKEIWTSDGSRFCGATFPGEVPNGWRMNSRYAVPDRRNRIGKELSRKLEALPKAMDAWGFSRAMDEAFPGAKESGESFFHWGDGKVYFTVWSKYGETFILNVPAGCRVKPRGCTELKMSEYWAINENASISEKKEDPRG